MNFGEELKTQRKRLGISQKEFSEIFEIPQRTIEDWEREKITAPEYVQELIIQKMKGFKIMKVIKETRAKDNNIAAECVCIKDYETRDEFNKALIEKIDSYNLDLIVLAGFLVVLPPELIAKYRNKIINIHPSLIPSFCGNGFYGLHVHEKALERGVKVTGATVHFVDEGTDTGPIIYQKAVEVLPDDTPETLQKRVMEQAEWKILPQAINAIANNLL